MARLISLRNFLLELLGENKVLLEALEDIFHEERFVFLFCTVAACVGIPMEGLEELKPFSLRLSVLETIEPEIDYSKMFTPSPSGMLARVLAEEAVSPPFFMMVARRIIEAYYEKNPTRIISPEPPRPVLLNIVDLADLFWTLSQMEERLILPPEPISERKIARGIERTVKNLSANAEKFSRVLFGHQLAGIDPHEASGEEIERVREAWTKLIGRPAKFLVGFRPGASDDDFLELVPDPKDAQDLANAITKRGTEMLNEFKAARPKSVKHYSRDYAGNPIVKSKRKS